jgi:hypothetical protein
MSKIGDLRDNLRTLLDEHEEAGEIPSSGRFLGYELKQRGQEYVIAHKPGSTHPRTPEQYVSEALMDFRLAGDIPWDWIADETRIFDSWLSAPTVLDWIIEAVERAVIDPWGGMQPLILTESRSLKGVLDPLARSYLADISSTNGQCGGFLRTDIAPNMYKDQHVIYLGDYNRAGGDIEANSRRVLEDIVGPLDWHRLLLTAEQIQQYRPPPKWTVDLRDGQGGATYEAESLGQTRLVAILRDHLDGKLPQPLASVQVREAAEREELLRYLRRRRARRNRRT